MKDIAILGAGGHARDILWLLENINDSLSTNEQWNLTGFYDKNPNETSMCGYPVFDEKELYQRKNMAVACGLGEPFDRKRVVDKLREKNDSLFFPALVSPDAMVSQRAQIGNGTQIFPGTMIMGGNVRIGEFVVIHINSTIGHDSYIGDYAQINPGCNISGGSILDECVMIGTGVKGMPKVHVGKNSCIGISSVITSDIPSDCTAVGYPARVIKRNKIFEEKKGK